MLVESQDFVRGADDIGMALRGDDWVRSCKLVIEFHAGPFSSPALVGDVHLVSHLEVWFSTVFVGLLRLSFLGSIHSLWVGCLAHRACCMSRAM